MFFLALTNLVAGSAAARVPIFSKLALMTRRRWPTRRWGGEGGGQEDKEEEGGDQRSGEHLCQQEFGERKRDQEMALTPGATRMSRHTCIGGHVHYS